MDGPATDTGPSPPRPHRPGGARGMSLRLVIAENNAIIAMDLADLLIGMGHDICAIARTEAEAVAAAERVSPDLMIVDGELDSGSGVAAMRRILVHGHVAHFYITGAAQSILADAPDAIVVEKPFTMLDLQRGIDAARARAAGAIPSL